MPENTQRFNPKIVAEFLFSSGISLQPPKKGGTSLLEPMKHKKSISNADNTRLEFGEKHLSNPATGVMPEEAWDQNISSRSLCSVCVLRFTVIHMAGCTVCRFSIRIEFREGQAMRTLHLENVILY